VEQEEILDRIKGQFFPEADPASTQPDEAEPVDAEEATQETAQESPQESETQHDEGEIEFDLADIAKVLDIDVDQLDVDEDGSLIILNKVDGETGRAKFKDYHTSYQRLGHIDRVNREAAELRKNYETKLSEFEATASKKLDELGVLTEALVTNFNQDFQNVDWNGLRYSDPAEYAAKYTEFQQRQNQLTQLINQVQTNRQTLLEQNRTKQSDMVKQGQIHLREAIPEWNDRTVFDKESQAIEDYALSVGFSPEEYSQLSDWRAVVILREAMLYRQMKKSAPALTKVVRKAPKIAKPGTTTQKVNSTAAALNKVKQTGGDKDSVLEYLKASGIV